MKEIDAPPQSYVLNTTTDEVRLSVSFGDGQSGDSEVELDDVVLASGTLTNLLLGTNSELKARNARMIVIRSIIDQTNSNTIHLSVVHVLTGGVTTVRNVVSDVFDKGTSAVVTQTVTLA
jgi:hypothetical protein